LVATPIGNLEDMTFRAIRTLKEVQLIAAEDTRQTRKLLTHFEIQNRLVSYHEHNREASGPELIRLLREGQHIALVSDAGIPAISDPGADLVRDAVAEGIPVVPIPGANAALSALIISGLPTDRFLFVGFPPRERKGLNKLLDGLEGESGTLIFYESPHRVKKSLLVIAERWSGRKMAIVRELTKRHEEAIRGTVAACLEHLEEIPPLGECCILIEGKSSATTGAGAAGDANSGSWWSSLTLDQHVAHYESLRLNRKEAMKSAATDRGLSRRDVYQALLEKNEQ
jgi:16S rRNA (cytidine1402-2'-O)-methyltransferase